MNVGVVVFSPDTKYLGCLCTQRYGRVSQLFADGRVNGPHLIQGSDYEYTFTHAWRNGLWNVYEPISLDLLDAESIRDKAVRWLGRAQCLSDAAEKFKLYALLGAPSDDRLRPAYIKAQNIMHKMDVPHDFVREDEAAGLARSLALEIVRSPVPKD